MFEEVSLVGTMSWIGTCTNESIGWRKRTLKELKISQPYFDFLRTERPQYHIVHYSRTHSLSIPSTLPKRMGAGTLTAPADATELVPAVVVTAVATLELAILELTQ